MTTSERCRSCLKEVQLQWLAPVTCGGRRLAGTGVWHSQRVAELCPSCASEHADSQAERQRRFQMYLRLVEIGGGEKPYREFRFENYSVTSDNSQALGLARAFKSDRDNLYLWGPCGVGKTHLAFAIARTACEAGQSIEFLKPPQLMRRTRMLDPNDEQRAIDRIARADLFVLDDLGIGNETPYARQVIQEILDARTSAYRTGLVVTSKYSLGDLAAKFDDDTITSRLAGMAQVVRIGGLDHRLADNFKSSASPRREP